MAARPLIVFYVNETLLDLGAMEPTFERVFGDKNAMRFCLADLRRGVLLPLSQFFAIRTCNARKEDHLAQPSRRHQRRFEGFAIQRDSIDQRR